MKTDEDIRDRVDIRSADVTGLNFIRDDGRFVFRKHYRQGLRSRILEVLAAEDVRKEAAGDVIDGIRVFPRAGPLKMLRIFTNRFARPEDALDEARRYRLIEAYLGGDHLAASSEFVVEYRRAGKGEIVLCGLQDYVDGEILDPWGFVYEKHFPALCRSVQARRRGRPALSLEDLIRAGRKSADSLAGRLKRMALEAGCIPDLSGVGNLILTPSGDIRLVDINNISRVVLDDAVRTDDKGYPVCDKSIEVIAILEREVLGRTVDRRDPLYGRFLDPGRMEKVKAVEKAFHRHRIDPGGAFG